MDSNDEGKTLMDDELTIAKFEKLIQECWEGGGKPSMLIKGGIVYRIKKDKSIETFPVEEMID